MVGTYRSAETANLPFLTLLISRNEQVSGSSPLVSSLFYDHLKEKR